MPRLGSRRRVSQELQRAWTRLPVGYPFVAVAVTACDLLTPEAKFAFVVAPSATVVDRAAIADPARSLDLGRSD
jgi:hypothetical protein